MGFLAFAVFFDLQISFDYTKCSQNVDLNQIQRDGSSGPDALWL